MAPLADSLLPTDACSLQCPGCPYGGLDMSRGLFDFFAPESQGVLYGTWSFDDGSDGSDESEED